MCHNTPVHGMACPRVVVLALSTYVARFVDRCIIYEYLCDYKIRTSLSIIMIYLNVTNVDIKCNSWHFSIIILYVISPPTIPGLEPRSRVITKQK